MPSRTSGATNFTDNVVFYNAKTLLVPRRLIEMESDSAEMWQKLISQGLQSRVEQRAVGSRRLLTLQHHRRNQQLTVSLSRVGCDEPKART